MLITVDFTFCPGSSLQSMSPLFSNMEAKLSSCSMASASLSDFKELSSIVSSTMICYLSLMLLHNPLTEPVRLHPDRKDSVKKLIQQFINFSLRSQCDSDLNILGQEV